MTPTEAFKSSNSSSPAHLNRAGLLAAVTILWSLIMSVTFNVWAPYPLAHRFNHNIDSPVLALELSRNQRDIDAVLEENESAKKALFWNTVLDCAFILLYSGYILLFGFAYHPRGLDKLALIVLTVGTALADYAENTRIFLILAARAHSVYIPSLIKWSLLGLVLILLSMLLLSKNPGPYTLPTRRLVGLGHIAAGALILLGIAFSHYAWLALGVELFAFTLLINAIGLLGPALAVHGTRQQFQTDFCEKRRRHQPVGPAVRDVRSSG